MNFDKRMKPVNKKATKKNRRKTEKSQKTDSKIAFAIIMFFIGVVTFAILSVLPKKSELEIQVYSKKISFSLPPESEEVHLLFDGIWTNLISIENFQPTELEVQSWAGQNDKPIFQNPITISPNPMGGGRITFSSAAEISLQKVVVDSAALVSLELDDNNLELEIHESGSNPYQVIDLAETITMTTQQCDVIDGLNQNLNHQFNASVPVTLPPYFRSIKVNGNDGSLSTVLSTSAIKTDTTQLLNDEIVHKMHFLNYFPGGKDQPKIDSIFVDNKSFKTSGLKITAEPNRFFIDNLSQIGNSLQVVAHGELESLQIGRVKMTEMVPSYLSSIIQNKDTSAFITLVGWLLTVVAPLLLKFFGK